MYSRFWLLKDGGWLGGVLSEFGKIEKYMTKFLYQIKF